MKSSYLCSFCHLWCTERKRKKRGFRRWSLHWLISMYLLIYSTRWQRSISVVSCWKQEKSFSSARRPLLHNGARKYETNMWKSFIRGAKRRGWKVMFCLCRLSKTCWAEQLLDNSFNMSNCPNNPSFISLNTTIPIATFLVAMPTFPSCLCIVFVLFSP